VSEQTQLAIRLRAKASLIKLVSDECAGVTFESNADGIIYLGNETFSREI